MNKNLKIIIPAAAIILAIIISLGVIMNTTASAQNRIYEGVYVNGVSLGNMTQEEAVKTLADKFNKDIKNKTIIMSHGNDAFTIDYNFLKAHYDIESAVKEAYSYGKSGNLLTKSINRMNLRKNKHEIKMNFVADTSSLSEEIKKISAKLNVDATDAKVSFNGGQFSIVADKAGKKVNEEKLAELIKSSIKPDGKEDKIDIPVDEVEARIKADMLSQVTTKVASFTTNFKLSDSNRSGNIKIAASSLNGTVLLPGETFSMNNTLGPRVKSKGYTEAPVIINGTLVPGLAGGICQVSSTLYNAALYANLQIVERRPHGLKVGYVDAGRDATISGDAIDLKFKNTYKNPIYIQAVVSGASITVNIYGANENPGQRVELYSEVYERIEPKIEEVNDPTLETGKKVVEIKPSQGYKSRTYRKIYQDGKLIKTELLSKDTYKATNGKIRVGTKPVSAPVVTPPVQPTEPSTTQ